MTANRISQQSVDTIPRIDPNDVNLNKVVDLRSQFEKQNSTYSTPTQPSKSLLRFLKKDELEMSEEALYWAHMIRDASTIFDENMTFRDTMIVDPLFMPPLFRGNVLPDNLTFYNFDFMQSKAPQTQLFVMDTIFKDVQARKEQEAKMMLFVENNYPTSFRYSLSDLPKEVVKAKAIKKTTYEDLSLKVKSEADFSDVTTPLKFIPARKYWQSHFESAIQFSQNYLSPNWHKGGSSNLNLFTKNYLRYDYNRDKVQLTNEMEVKVSFYTAPKDTLHNYKMGDDIFRLHSNFGYKAFNKWFYTFDAEFKTQLFTNYAENTTKKLAALLSPMSVNLGLGMKYELNHIYKQRHKNLKLTVNMAPASYTYMYSTDKNIDLGRHGFKKIKGTDKFDNQLSQFGSTMRADLLINFNRNVSWQSRVYYFTSYDHVVGEFENTLTLAINRFFSTRIYAHLRYDDGVTKTEGFDSYFQVNELLSFGFNYKW
ncbi:MAG: DUF3078 domain-containing protein [Tannerellaceae bacterium]